MYRSNAYPMRLELEPSSATRVLTVAFAMCCASSVVVTLAPRLGTAAYLIGMTVFAGLVAFAALQSLRRPDALKIGPDGVVTAYRARQPLRQGTLQGFYQWGGFHLALELRSAKGRSWFISIAADAVGPEYFRELAVRVRQCEREARRASPEEV